jgi:hypothetical protein
MAQGTCSTDNCDSLATHKGLCKKCYMKARRDRIAQEKCIHCDRPRSTVTGLCVPHYQREREYGDALAGPPLRKQRAPSKAAGTTSKYHKNHVMVRKARGPAWMQPCANCGNGASDWATIHGESGEQPVHYLPLCRACHVIYDGTIANLANRRTGHSPETRERQRQAALRRWESQDERDRMREISRQREARKREAGRESNPRAR